VVIAGDDWEDATHHIKLIFGEYCFYRFSFTASELKKHPARLTAPLAETTIDVLPVLDRHGAVVIPAHPVAEPPRRVQVARTHLQYVAAESIYHFIEVGSSFEEYLRRLPRKHRHDWQRKQRRFSERSGGAVDMRCYRSVAETRTFFALAASLSARTYQHRLLGVGLPQTDAAAAELEARAQRDAIRGYVLFYRGTAIAYALASVADDWLQFAHIGYDPSFADWSPGSVLVYEAMRAAFAERRFALLDFGAGEAQFKRAWATRSLPCATVFVFRPTVRTLTLVAAHRACTEASDRCVRVLDRVGAKHRLKRYFRKRVAAKPG
jgi:CelD/BcsL family acetyltransferase involved in cellulose biosynthesis